MTEEWKQRLLSAIAAYIDVIDEPLVKSETVNAKWDEVVSVIDEVAAFAQVGKLVMDMYDWCNTGKTGPFKSFVEQVKS